MTNYAENRRSGTFYKDKSSLAYALETARVHRPLLRLLLFSCVCVCVFLISFTSIMQQNHQMFAILELSKGVSYKNESALIMTYM